MKISVVIPTYNSWFTLKASINSIQKQTLKPFEIIVVDNGSSDSTSQKVKSMFPEVKLITLINNSGVTGGRNKGIEEAYPKSDYILFFDHDMVADKRMVEELVKILQSNKLIGIATPKIYYSDDKKRIWAAGTAINLWTGQVLFRGGKDVGQYEVAQEVQVAPAVLLVKKTVISKIRSFDDRYFATYEDTDFCFRAKIAGFSVGYVPSALAYHKISSDPGNEAKRLLSRSYWVGRNRILFMRDFGNNFYIFLLFLPIYIIYYLRLAIKFGRFIDWLKFIQGVLAGLVASAFLRKTLFSGERPSLTDIDGLHLAKYRFALKFCKGKKITEFGCGTGYGSKYLAQNGVKKIMAYDIDLAAVNFAIKNSPHENITYIQADIETLQLNSKYDVILAFEVIEHLKNPRKLLELAKSGLRKGGVFILSTPNKAYSILNNGKPSNPYHIYEYYPKELKDILLKYFKSVQLYGVVLGNKEIADKEKQLHNSLRWKFINFLTNRRLIRRVMNYLPEYPKRLISGESKLSFKTEDFQVLKKKTEESTDFVAVCI